MRDKSITWVIDHLGYGGTQRVLNFLVAYFAKRGYSQRIICLNKVIDKRSNHELDKLGVRVLFVGRWRLLVGFGMPLIFYWLVRKKSEYLFSFLFFSDVISLPLAKLARVPNRISAVRANNLNYSVWQQWLLRKSIRSATSVTCNSKLLTTYIEQYLEIPGEDVVVLPNPVEIKPLPTKGRKGQLRGEFQISERASLIGSCGRISHQKGYDCLLDAMKILDDLDIHLVVFGEGKERKQLARKAASLGIANRVNFPGHREDVEELLSSVDLYVQTSRFEGMPNSLIEAMAYECVVIGSNIDGISELLGSEQRGWLVPPDQPTVLANTIRKALENKEESREKAELARIFVKTHYEKDKACAIWESFMTNQNRKMTNPIY